MRRVPQALAALFTVTLAVGIGAPTASARAQIGVSITTGAGSPSASLDRQLDVVRASGAKLARIGVSWSSLEPAASGQYDGPTLAAADHAVAGARARGLRVVLTMSSTPCWASSSPAATGGCAAGNSFEVTRYPPSNPGDFVPVATFMAKRYGRTLAAFEVWNEPDQANEQYWAGPDKVARYVALARAVYGPLKRANPQMKVLAGAFVGYDGRWLKALYAAGIRGSYDGLSVHFYNYTLWAVRRMRALQLAHHDRAPMWIAESGWTSCASHAKTYQGHSCVTRAAQARFTADLIASVRRRSGAIAALLIYTAQDQAGEDFGLVDRQGRAKPVLAAMRRAVTRSFPAVTPLRLALGHSGAGLAVSGSGPAGDVVVVRAYHGGYLRFRAQLGLDRRGRYRLRIPASVGTHGTTVTVTSPWLMHSATRRSS